ncbi:thiamine pyrophosphate-binding protein [Actinocatenispora sera]|uniref:thiamine pyrophosphate-binding protein n=1 Tax=Actinocatenispora sera TaxID=390989 RepID=UPI0033E2A303
MARMVSGRGGELAVAALAGYGIGEVFTPAGEHVPAIHDAARAARMRVVEVRHEQTAVFAAEAVATLLRRPGLAVLGAGPGVTNAVSAITAAHFNAAPVVVLAGRAPAWRWGTGSLPALDHVAIVDSVTNSAATCTEVGNIGADVHAAVVAALTPHRGPAFLDLPMDVVFCTGETQLPAPTLPPPVEPDPAAVARAGALLAAAERPVIIAGSDVYSSDAVAALRECAETWRVPVFTTGLARGALPGDHPLAFRCCKRAALARADLVAVLGTAPDLRLGGGTDARLIHVVDAPPAAGVPAGDDGTLWVAGDLRLVLSGMADHRGVRADHADWIELLRVAEDTARAQKAGHLADDREPIRATRLYAELRRALTDDAIIVGDGGDVVTAAARHLDPGRPGSWLDGGRYGSGGAGLGYALGAALACPDRPVCGLLGDGAAAGSVLEVESLVRHHLPVVLVVGNNGSFGTAGLRGADDRTPGLRLEKVVAALGGAGETVATARQLAPALHRAFESRVPYLLNVLIEPRTDPV